MAPSPLVAFADEVRRGPPLFLGWVGMPEPLVAGTLARSGFDAVLLDQQHGLVDDRALALAVAEVTLAGKATLARIPVGGFALASRALDAGVAGVVAPMINSVDDARRFAAFMKFPPLGERSWGPVRALPLTGLDPAAYLKQANRFSLAIAMIETREALDAIDGILAVAGIDGVLFGPSDASIALSQGKRVDPNHPDVDRAAELVVARARAAGKIACAFALTAERAKVMAGKGFHLTAVATDGMLLRQGAEAALAVARG